MADHAAGPAGPLHPRIAAALVGLLLLLALLRGAALLLHEPLIGLANNYDMIRVQGCIEAYPLRAAEVPPASNSWQAPIARYRFQDLDLPCFPTSEALFAYAALPWLRFEAARSPDGSFPLRAIGALKLAAAWLLAVAIAVALLRRRRPLLAIGSAVLALSLLFDPGVTIYLNTLYAEFAAVLFGWAALACTAVALLDRRPSRWWLAACAFAVALAALSKIQHVLFGALLCGVLLLVLLACRQRAPRLLLAVALGALAGAALQATHMGSQATASIRQANLTNTVLEAVLGNARDPQATARRLGLPARCGEHAGANWFSEGLQQSHPCPELFAMSRLRIVGLAFVEPQTVARALVDGFGRTRPWLPPILGLVEGAERAPLPDTFFSWSRPLQALPVPVYALLFVLPPLVVAGWLRRRRGRVSAALALPLAFTALYPPYALAVVVFGDGVADVSKQFHLGTLALLAFWHLAVLLALGALLHRRAAPSASGTLSRP